MGHSWSEQRLVLFQAHNEPTGSPWYEYTYHHYHPSAKGKQQPSVAWDASRPGAVSAENPRHLQRCKSRGQSRSQSRGGAAGGVSLAIPVAAGAGERGGTSPCGGGSAAGGVSLATPAAAGAEKRGGTSPGGRGSTAARAARAAAGARRTNTSPSASPTAKRHGNAVGSRQPARSRGQSGQGRHVPSLRAAHGGHGEERGATPQVPSLRAAHGGHGEERLATPLAAQERVQLPRLATPGTLPIPLAEPGEFDQGAKNLLSYNGGRGPIDASLREAQEEDERLAAFGGLSVLFVGNEEQVDRRREVNPRPTAAWKLLLANEGSTPVEPDPIESVRSSCSSEPVQPRIGSAASVLKRAVSSREMLPPCSAGSKSRVCLTAESGLDFGRVDLGGIFRKFAHMGEMVGDTEVLMAAMKLVGYAFPSKEWLTEISHEIICGRTVLDLDDFQTLVEGYETRYEASIEAAFADHAGSGGGSRKMSLEEAQNALNALGLPALPGAIEEAICDTRPGSSSLLGAPSRSGLSRISSRTFARIYRELISRAGITKQDERDLLQAFNAADEGRRGFITAEQMKFAFQRHYCRSGIVTFKIVDRCVAEAVHQSKTFDWKLDCSAWEARPLSGAPGQESATQDIDVAAFLLAARGMLDELPRCLGEAVDRLCFDKTGEMGMSDLSLILYEVGCVSRLTPDFLQECLDKAGVHRQAMLKFNEVISVLRALHELHGFSSREHKELERAFKRYAKQEPKTISYEEVRMALRSLGYQASTYRLYDLIEDHDLQLLERLELSEFTKVVAAFRWSAIGVARDRFRPDRGKWMPIVKNRLPTSDLLELIGVAGYAMQQAILDEIWRKLFGDATTMCYEDFLEVEATVRQGFKEQVVRNEGFSDDSCQVLKDDFERHIPRTYVSGEKYVNSAGLQAIVLADFPELDDEMRVLVGQTDADGSGKIELDELLTTMRSLLDLTEKRELRQALQLRVELGFSKSEMKQLRSVYKMCDVDFSGDVDFEELQSMLKVFVQIDASSKDQLIWAFNHFDTNKDQTLDFFEFLRLIRYLMDKNWQNINEAWSE